MSYAEELGSEVRNLEKSIIVKTNLEIEKKKAYQEGYMQALEDMYQAAVLAHERSRYEGSF